MKFYGVLYTLGRRIIYGMKHETVDHRTSFIMLYSHIHAVNDYTKNAYDGNYPTDEKKKTHQTLFAVVAIS